MTIENIIVVGGGYAGVSTAQALEKKLTGDNNYRIILIDKVIIRVADKKKSKKVIYYYY